MKFLDFEVGNKTYQLRLTTRSIVNLEKKIGMNPLAIFGQGDVVPTLTTMLTIFHCALQATHRTITEDDAYNLFDEWLDEGHSLAEFVPVILDIYKVSGLINEEAIDEKN